MGMDVHGLNPKQNKNIDDFPTMKKFDSMDFAEKWKTLDKDDNFLNGPAVSVKNCNTVIWYSDDSRRSFYEGRGLASHCSGSWGLARRR